MSGLIESATAILSVSERRLEIAAHNVANVSTPGFKRQIGFSQLISATDGRRDAELTLGVRPDLSSGAVTETGNPLDLAIGGAGLFALRTPDGLIYTRQGSFRLRDDGLVISSQGHVLQQAGGGDLELRSADVEILDDGTVLDEGAPAGRIGVFLVNDPSFAASADTGFSATSYAATPDSEPGLRQGFLENSNVSLTEEMVSTMAAGRQAETGARLVQVYDQLMGRVLSTLGQGGGR